MAVASVGRREVDGTLRDAWALCMAAGTGLWKGMLYRREVGRSKVDGSSSAGGRLGHLFREVAFVGAEERATMPAEAAEACRAVAEVMTGRGWATVGRSWTGTVHAMGVVSSGRRKGSGTSSGSLAERMW